MERQVIYRDRVEVTADDLNNPQLWAQEALDRVVVQTLVPGRKFFGFTVSSPSSTTVRVADGLLYFDGRRYFTDTDGAGTTLPLSIAGLTQSKIYAIVVFPQDQDTSVDIQERDYEVDAGTETYEPQAVNMERRRWAQIQSVGGPEAVQPQPPVVVNTAVVIAYVTVSTGGILSIAMRTENEVPNLYDVAVRLDAAELGLEDILPKIATIRSDLAKIDERTKNVPDGALLNAVTQDVAALKVAANLGQNYVQYRGNDFANGSLSDEAFSGYSAKTDEGLRFAPDAENVGQLALFNPFNPDAKTSGAGLLLPNYVANLQRIIRGNAGTMSLAQYAYEARTLTVATMSRQRVRYGEEFEAPGGFLDGGTFLASYERVKNVFQKSGETFQVYDTGQTNPDGTRVIRLAKFWFDTVDSPYWKRISTDTANTGYAWIQSFVQAQSGWAVAVHPKFVAKPASGAIIIGLMKMNQGQPDFSNVIAMVTGNPSDFPLPVPAGHPGLAIEPTFLEAGQRYGYFYLTAGDYVTNVTDAANNAGGTMFYGVNGGVYYPDATRNIMFDLSFASFAKNQVSIDLANLQLSGGIAAIDILADAITPPGTFAHFEVQIAGFWHRLNEASVSVLAALPPNLPLRYVMGGNSGLMPGLKLSGSRARISRPKVTFKHVGDILTLPGASTADKVTIKSTLRDFDSAHHTYTAKVLRGTGYTTVETADTTTDEVRDARTTIRTQVFNLAANVTTYRMENDGTTDSASNLFAVSSTFELAVDVP